MLNRLVITVSQLNHYIKTIFECDTKLKNIFVSGEVSNFRCNYQSGHLYFSLKEGNSVVKAVMFSGNARRLRFEIKDGMNVIVRGNVQCYEVSGQYQICVDDIQPYGLGACYLEFEQLKQKLYNEGLFDDKNKKPIPKYPSKIGVVTSISGAAVKDIENVLKRRYPIAEMVIYPVQVQGSSCVEQIINVIKKINKGREVDVIILGRGGGATEELWLFNDEKLARCISESSVPIVSAVGHETDFTICDFVSDRRAPTPSVAAEICTPDKDVFVKLFADMRDRIDTLIYKKVEFYKKNLYQKADTLKFNTPVKKLNTYKKRLQLISKNQYLSMKNCVDKKRYEVDVLKSKLEAINPLSVMKRGYAIITDHTGIVKNKDVLKENSKIRVRLFDGEVECRIVDVRSISNGRER